jgi:hypothetical protein
MRNLLADNGYSPTGERERDAGAAAGPVHTTTAATITTQ